MRTVRGSVVVPPDAGDWTARLFIVQVRDVSVMDAPSIVIGEMRAADVAVAPGGRLAFELAVPDAEPGHSLSVRAHLSADGTTSVQQGDAISTTHVPIPPAGDVDGIEVPVRAI